ncbi:oxidoreductase [Actinokineospora fastidiosa]|uniref:Oxidoreductase n=1 Tax=Actinokineospora fastidiosa TaxID=1816 RepID=A0A918LBY1_9PSEU|nr:oxidoreductase [Actinokineospora fastidiosa]
MLTAPLTADALLTRTRSVRRRLDLTRPVPLSLVEECLRIAQQAPCGSGRTPAHWLVVTDPDTRAELGRIYRSAFADQWSGRVPPTGLTGAQRRSIDSAAYLAQVLGEVPVLVLACVETGAPLPPGNQAALWGTLLPAVWSYMLAARSHGLGTTWTAAHLRHEKEVADLLAIPEGIHQGALIPTAYHLGTDFHPASRPPLNTTLHLDRW